MINIIRKLFSSSPLDKAFKNCLAADQALVVRVMMFYESYKAVGIDLSPDPTSLAELDCILGSCDEDTHELTFDAVSAFLGCIVRETLGGKWRRTNGGKYAIAGVGRRRVTVDVDRDLRARLETGATAQEVYADIRDKAAVEPSRERPRRRYRLPGDGDVR